MNTEGVLNSIYNPKKQEKEAVILPKISKLQPSPHQSRIIAGPTGRKYNQQNVFKIEDQKKPKLQLKLEDQNIKDMRKRQADEIQNKMSQLQRRHDLEIEQIDRKQKQLTELIQREKKKQYQIKLNMWNLKNDIFQLNSLYIQEDTINRRLESELEAKEEQYGDQNEGQYQQQGYGNGQEGSGQEGVEGQEQLEMQIAEQTNQTHLNVINKEGLFEGQNKLG